MKAIRVHQPGGPDVMQLEDIPVPQPGPGQVLVRVEAAGVNFIDIYHRSGAYKLDLPFTPGMEGAGTVEAVGEGVDDFKPGDRVAWAMALGSYAQYAVVPARVLARVPEGVPADLAAAVMLQGMTAHYLAYSTFPLKPGHRAVVHAAAGGVGLLLVQIAKRLGATVYGTVSTPEKAEAARRAGADEVIIYTQTDFAAAVRDLTGGEGVDVVYDGVGRDTFEGSMSCLKPRGYLVLFGQSSGAVPPLDPQVLNNRGSLFLTRPTLAHYILNREELDWRSGDLFRWIGAGELQVTIDSTFDLADAPKAHQRLASRQSSGKILLRIPA
ncbi:MAG: NADPH:quinone reductase [Bacillota bacterium]|nr:NADPH:quinone reductase [Bacillota bacterium]REJ35808.1 MAG: NADPH:quinone reductase [Bacillota bacterium]